MTWWHWLVIHLSQETGTSNEASRSYAWWSGFGSAGLVSTSMFANWYHRARAHNCEIHGCWRIGHRATAAGHTVCRRHHPSDDRLTVGRAHREHREALDGRG